MKIDVLVAKIIKAPNFDNFTTSDVRSSYMTLKSDPLLDPTQVRRKLYAELLKLVKKGWLKKKSSNVKGLTRFSKTDLFDVSALNESSAEETNIKPVIQDKQQTLIDKLKYYKTELLLNIGETDAYKELYSELPELVDEIQPQYNLARDNNTKILGKIRALESLIDKHKLIEVK